MSYKVGDMVSWNSSGGRAQGKIVHVMRTGVLGVPDSKFKVNAEPNDPAVLIQIFRDGKETKTFVGHKMSTVTKTLLEKHLPGKHDQSLHAKSRSQQLSIASADLDNKENQARANYRSAGSGNSPRAQEMLGEADGHASVRSALGSERKMDSVITTAKTNMDYASDASTKGYAQGFKNAVQQGVMNYSALNKSLSLMEKHMPGKHDQSVHGKGGKGGTGGGAGGGGTNLSPEKNKQVNSLAIDLFNHGQKRPVRSGPKLDEWRKKGRTIVDQASSILKLPQDKTITELRSRMGG